MIRMGLPPATNEAGQLISRLLSRSHLIGLGALRHPLWPATAAHGSMENESDHGANGSNPHKHHHLDPNFGLDVELVLCREGKLGGKTNGRGNDGGHANEDGGDEGDNGDGEGEPSCADDEGGREHEAEVDDGAGCEEGIHDAGADAEERQNGVDFGGEGDGGAGKEL